MGKNERNGSDKEGDIVKKGYIYIKRPPTSGSLKIRLKAWQRRYFVLRDDSYENGPTTLEIYHNEQAWDEQKGYQQYTVDLKKVTQVEEYLESKNFPDAFIVSRKGQCPLILGADSPMEKQEWFMAIKLMSDKLNSSRLLQLPSPEERRPSCPPRLNCEMPARGHWRSQTDLHGGQPRGGSPSLQVLRLPPPDILPRRDRTLCMPDKQGFNVLIQRTQAAEKHMLEGQYVLIVRSEHIALRRSGWHDDVLNWPIVNIRKFKCEASLDGQGEYVTLEGNIHCGRAEGTYVFKTRHGKELIRLVRDAAREMSVRESPGKVSRPPIRDQVDLTTHHKRFHRIGSAPCLDEPPPQGSPSHRELLDLPDSLFSSPAPSPPKHHPGSGTATDNVSSDDEDVVGAHALGKFNSYLQLIEENLDMSFNDNNPLITPSRSNVRHQGSVSPTPGTSTSSNHSTQFQLDDLVPLSAVPQTPRRRDSGFSDSGNSFLYNDVFEHQEPADTPRTSPKTSYNLDQCIPTRSGSPPPLPPRPRHTLSDTTRSLDGNN